MGVSLPLFTSMMSAKFVFAVACAVIAAVSAFPSPNELKEQAPEEFLAEFNTGKPDKNFVVQINRAWAPKGADRFYNLVKSGFYDDCRVFRNVQGFVAQFGI